MTRQARIPSPNKASVLERLTAHVPISAVVDVGVRDCTMELIEAFPGLKHYLFEPVTLFFDRIKANYRHIECELMPVALSDLDSQIYLVLSSLGNDGVVTHSRIVASPVPVDGLTVVSCSTVQVRRFDSLFREREIPNNYLLKVDVDGKDLEVVRGFGDRLAEASAVVIECTFFTYLDRAAYLTSRGFSLVDIVDIIYYGESIYQFDAVFVRKDLVTSELRPSIDNFRHEIWYRM